jgi:hypothetical protein
MKGEKMWFKTMDEANKSIAIFKETLKEEYSYEHTYYKTPLFSSRETIIRNNRFRICVYLSTKYTDIYFFGKIKKGCLYCYSDVDKYWRLKPINFTIGYNREDNMRKWEKKVRLILL